MTITSCSQLPSVRLRSASQSNHRHRTGAVHRAGDLVTGDPCDVICLNIDLETPAQLTSSVVGYRGVRFGPKVDQIGHK